MTTMTFDEFSRILWMEASVRTIESLGPAYLDPTSRFGLVEAVLEMLPEDSPVTENDICAMATWQELYETVRKAVRT